MKTGLFALIGLLLFTGTVLSAGGKAEKTPADWASVREEDKVMVEGKVRQVGNAPFSQIVITDDRGNDWYPDEEGMALLKRFEHQKVKVTAKVHLKAMTLPNGTELAAQRILINLKLEE
ncbi:MAG: hypothetical protein PQJ59_02265 [Spirochaetales bacterium]|nr:hypothetical protein [Spirochaetales bacterium]